MSETRRSYRLPIEIPATFKVKEGQKHISIGTTLNVSALGICLKTKEKLDNGQHLDIKLKLPTGEDIVIHTVVVWVKEMDFYAAKDYSVGVKISDVMYADEAKFIKYYVKQFLQAPPDTLDKATSG